MRFPDLGLTGGIAIVTGASKGLGYGVALALANAGAHVVVTSRDIRRARPVAGEIREMGRESLPLELEVRSRTASKPWSTRRWTALAGLISW
jgi:gluconate 5-dehydrogenase